MLTKLDERNAEQSAYAKAIAEHKPDFQQNFNNAGPHTFFFDNGTVKTYNYEPRKPETKDCQYCHCKH